jgi:hypothetical protein
VVQCILKRLSHLSDGFSICEWAFSAAVTFFLPPFLSFFWEKHISSPHPFFREPRPASLLCRAVFFFLSTRHSSRRTLRDASILLLSLQSARAGSFGVFAWRSDDDGTLMVYIYLGSFHMCMARSRFVCTWLCGFCHCGEELLIT